MQSESGHPGSSRLRLAFFPGSIVVVFGAAEYPAPIRLRLFHVEGRRFEGVAYRVSPNPDGPDGSTLWTPDAFGEADLLQAAEHIPSIRIVHAGCPTILEVGDDDLTTLAAMARPPRPRRFAGPWRRRGAGLPPRPSTAEEA